MTTSVTVAETPLVVFCLRRADDALILGHRLSEWSGKAPTLEEDLALSNIALDLIGQARALYQYAGELTGQAEDELAYLRDERAYRNLLLVEQPNGDFSVTIARQLLYTAYADPFWRAMTRSADPTLAAIAARAEKETAYHLRHAGEWLIRLGDGTDESHRRASEALTRLWPFTGELFTRDAADDIMIAAGIAIDPAELRPAWSRTIDTILARATLPRPADGWMQSGGRDGRHGEHLGFLLAELQFLPRSHPGAAW
jgi:ring-1,2-phenylacetyl-CoA epoxidase subunit PaaC